MLRRAGKAQLAVTPDGPRGPRRQVQPGVVYLAARTGLPIVAVGFAYSRAWRTGSWDRFAVPWPWSSAVLRAPRSRSVVPERARGDQLEAYRERVQDAIRRAEEAAERILPARPAPRTPSRPEGRLTPPEVLLQPGIGIAIVPPPLTLTRTDPNRWRPCR